MCVARRRFGLVPAHLKSFQRQVREGTEANGSAAHDSEPSQRGQPGEQAGVEVTGIADSEFLQGRRPGDVLTAAAERYSCQFVTVVGA